MSGNGRPVRLAIVGRHRAATFSALRAGFDVVTADLFADEDLRQRCPATRIDRYPEGLADWLAKQDVDAWMYTGALENHPALVDRMAEVRPLWGNRGDALRRVRDPFELLRAGRNFGFHVPVTAGDRDGLPTDGSWLCKTYRGSSGGSVWRLDGRASLQRALETSAVFQELVEGASASAVFAVDGSGGRLLGVTEQLIGEFRLGAAPWCYCGSVARRDLIDAAHVEQLSRVGHALHERFHMRGLVGVDLVLDRDRAWVVEVNPRYSASIEVLESAGGFAVVADHARCFGDHPHPELKTAGEPLAGKAVLFAKRPVTISETFVSHSWQAVQEGRWADVPATGTVIEAGQPILTVLDRSGEQGVVERLLDSTAEIEAQLIH